MFKVICTYLSSMTIQTFKLMKGQKSVALKAIISMTLASLIHSNKNFPVRNFVLCFMLYWDEKGKKKVSIHIQE